MHAHPRPQLPHPLTVAVAVLVAVIAALVFAGGVHDLGGTTGGAGPGTGQATIAHRPSPIVRVPQPGRGRLALPTPGPVTLPWPRQGLPGPIAPAR